VIIKTSHLPLPRARLHPTTKPNLSRLLMTFLIKTIILLSLLTFSHSYGEPKRNPCEGIADLSIGAEAEGLHRKVWPIDRSIPDPTASAQRHAAVRAGSLTQERQCWAKVDDRLRDNAAMSDIARNVCVAAFERTLCHMASHAVAEGMKDPKFVNSWCSTEYDLAHKAGQRCLSGDFTSNIKPSPANTIVVCAQKRVSRFPFAFIGFLLGLNGLFAFFCSSRPHPQSRYRWH